MRHGTAGQKRLGISIIQRIWHDELIGLSTNSSKATSSCGVLRTLTPRDYHRAIVALKGVLFAKLILSR